MDWLNWLRAELGFDGWRFDFAKVALDGLVCHADCGCRRMAALPATAPCQRGVRQEHRCRLTCCAPAACRRQGYHPRFTAEYIERTCGPEAFCVAELFLDRRHVASVTT